MKCDTEPSELNLSACGHVLTIVLVARMLFQFTSTHSCTREVALQRDVRLGFHTMSCDIISNTDFLMAMMSIRSLIRVIRS
jgi:hypothetical protein